MNDGLLNAAHRVTAARDDVADCLADRIRFPRAAEAVAIFRAACEVLDLEHQLRTGSCVRPADALDVATRLSGRDISGER